MPLGWHGQPLRPMKIREGPQCAKWSLSLSAARGRPLVAKRLEDGEHFAAGGKHPATGSLVMIEGLHELDLLGQILPLTGGRIDETAAAVAGAASAAGGGGGGAADDAGSLGERGGHRMVSPRIATGRATWATLPEA